MILPQRQCPYGEGKHVSEQRLDIIQMWRAMDHVPLFLL
jgi:hypothetical protein